MRYRADLDNDFARANVRPARNLDVVILWKVMENNKGFELAARSALVTTFCFSSLQYCFDMS